MLKIDKPLILFDVETTGLFIELDRIIELSLIKLLPDGKTQKLTQRFDPEMKIPVEVTAIHGITNEQLKGQPRFADKAAELFKLFEGCDLGGYSIARLDIPMLTKEFERAGFVFSMEGRRVVDAAVIFQEKERRNLTAAYKFYCGKELLDAHSAEADINATLEVLENQLEKYADLPRDVEGLHEFCRRDDPGNVDRQGKLVWRDGEAFFSFGRYRYKSLKEVAVTAPDYLDWILNKKDFPPDFLEICARARRGIFPKKETAASGEQA